MTRFGTKRGRRPRCASRTALSTAPSASGSNVPTEIQPFGAALCSPPTTSATAAVNMASRRTSIGSFRLAGDTGTSAAGAERHHTDRDVHGEEGAP